MLVLLLLFLLFILLFLSKPKQHYNIRFKPKNKPVELVTYQSNKKPEWVTEEVLRIKAQSPNLSCRLVSHIFNRKFAHKDESVGKTFVSYTIRNNLYKIKILRKEWKNKEPHKVRFNRYWGMDITFVDNKPLLGVTEHHSRKLIGLIPLSKKASLNIIIQLSLLLRRFDKPKIIRTDNEACFNSKTIKLFFTILGIKHQAIEKHCPWQNGRIERLFGTLKATISGLVFKTEELPLICYDFQQWYNAIRPHQNLKGKTPEEVYWDQVRKRYRH